MLVPLSHCGSGLVPSLSHGPGISQRSKQAWRHEAIAQDHAMWKWGSRDSSAMPPPPTPAPFYPWGQSIFFKRPNCQPVQSSHFPGVSQMPPLSSIRSAETSGPFPTGSSSLSCSCQSVLHPGTTPSFQTWVFPCCHRRLVSALRAEPLLASPPPLHPVPVWGQLLQPQGFFQSLKAPNPSGRLRTGCSHCREHFSPRSWPSSLPRLLQAAPLTCKGPLQA